MGSKEVEEEEDEGPPPGWQSLPPPSSSSQQPPPPQPPPPSGESLSSHVFSDTITILCFYIYSLYTIQVFL